MQPEVLRALPIRVRPAAHETPDSFEDRLRVANAYPQRAWNVVVNDALRAARATDVESRTTAVEALGALDDGHFTRGSARAHTHTGGGTCDGCLNSLADRYACTWCTHGQVAAQLPHDGPRVCRRHMRWVGPGTEPSDQFTVDIHVLRADRGYRRLRRVGLIDAPRLAELLACVNAWATATGQPLDPAQRFCLAVDIAQALIRSALFSGAEVETPATRHAALRDIVEDLLTDQNSNVLVDALWLLLRADRAAGARPHSFTARGGINADRAEELELLASSFYPRVRHLQLTQMVQGSGRGDRFEQAARLDHDNDYVCATGHPFTSTGRRLRASKASGGCGVCARRRVSPETSLAATHPHYAAEWHSTMNGSVQPTDIFSGTGDEYIWLCPAGHSYPASPNSRTSKGSGCGYCANQLIDSTNCLRTTHPELSKEWNVELNGTLTPADVVAGTEESVWWTCNEGHDFPSSPYLRTRGSGCHVCTHQTVHPSTCLATTHPEVAAMWHPTRNGGLTPEDVFPGSIMKAWWRCENGCDYDGAIVSRVRGFGCRFCSNRAVSKKNCMRATRPDLAAQFHPTKNGKHTPDTVVAGTSHRLWWLCELGHDWPVSGDNRVRQGTGCPYCSNKKVWPGFNDMGTTRPDLASDFHPTLNGDVTPLTVVAGTGKRLFWQCACGNVWRATGDQRVKGRQCGECRNK